MVMIMVAEIYGVCQTVVIVIFLFILSVETGYSIYVHSYIFARKAKAIGKNVRSNK